MGTFTSSLDSENYSIKVYPEKIIVSLNSLNLLNEDMLKDFDLKIKNVINVLNMEIRFKIDKIKIGDDEIKFVSSEFNDVCKDKIKLYNDNRQNFDIKLVYKIK
jgi:hypothetical protein